MKQCCKCRKIDFKNLLVKMYNNVARWLSLKMYQIYKWMLGWFVTTAILIVAQVSRRL